MRASAGPQAKSRAKSREPQKDPCTLSSPCCIRAFSQQLNLETYLRLVLLIIFWLAWQNASSMDAFFVPPKLQKTCHPEQERRSAATESASKDLCTLSFRHAASGSSSHALDANPSPRRGRLVVSPPF